MSEQLEQILDVIYDDELDGDAKTSEAYVQKALDTGVAVEVVLNEGLIAPITDKFANQIGADGFAADAGKAVTLVHSQLGVA